jgi:hypothetical protein
MMGSPDDAALGLAIPQINRTPVKIAEPAAFYKAKEHHTQAS